MSAFVVDGVSADRCSRSLVSERRWSVRPDMICAVVVVVKEMLCGFNVGWFFIPAVALTVAI